LDALRSHLNMAAPVSYLFASSIDKQRGQVRALNRLELWKKKKRQHPDFFVFVFANRILALKETTNSTKHPKKNENYNEILEKPLIFNLRTVSTARRRCRSSLSRPDVVGCGREVAERVKKTTSVPKTKKKEELPMKLLDDSKIPTATRNPRRPLHSHKPLDVADEMGLKPQRPYCMRHRHHHLSAASTNLNPKNEERSP
jgi:hypothetical protein